MKGCSALMYRKILVAMENSQADDSLLPHVAELAKQLGSEEAQARIDQLASQRR